MTEWQPIDAAPKGYCLNILVSAKGKRAQITHWSPDFKAWMDDSGEGWHLNFRPTHWMPLPDAPKGE